MNPPVSMLEGGVVAGKAHVGQELISRRVVPDDEGHERVGQRLHGRGAVVGRDVAVEAGVGV